MSLSDFSTEFLQTAGRQANKAVREMTNGEVTDLMARLHSMVEWVVYYEPKKKRDQQIRVACLKATAIHLRALANRLERAMRE